ncbi:MAG: D-alanine--poly(phosphoribitol) ligase subunit DltA, partial [Staphylococcus sp.]|nr:D-alanine--poly(phosphoribitol) ligase subunit DltA [Staphylococcus sp.]
MTDIINLINDIGQKNPDRVAIRHKSDELTYRQLIEESSKLAHYLQDTNKPLIIYGHMSPYMVVGMIGAIKAGCGYVPIDTSVPIERVEMIMNKVDPTFILNTTDSSVNQPRKELTIEDIKHSDYPIVFDSQMDKTDVVYTIFTSGSTGEPKGVQIEYASLIEFAEWMVSLNETDNHQEWLNQAPFSFDLSVMAIYPCLTSGGTLNLVDKDMIKKPKLLNEMLVQTPINAWVSTPSFIEMCFIDKNFNQSLMPKVKQFVFCGEKLFSTTVEKIHKNFENAQVINTYGPKESTVMVTWVEITKEVNQKYYENLPVGEVKWGTKVHLANPDEENKGEIVITGNTVAKGYFKNDAITNEKFGVGEVEGKEERSYVTGDLGYFKDDMLFCEGRIDFQVKLHGHRIELEDIDNNLL